MNNNPDPDWDFGSGSGFDEYGSETLKKFTSVMVWPLCTGYGEVYSEGGPAKISGNANSVISNKSFILV